MVRMGSSVYGVLVIAIGVTGCGRLGFDLTALASIDGSMAETGTIDASSPDASSPDGSAMDARTMDAGSSDAEPADASSDAAMADSGGVDGGQVDAGACVAPTGGLIVRYEFDETSGTTASDSSGSGNVGALAGSSGPNWVPGRRGTALSFDTADNEVTAPPNASINDLAALTVCAWIFPRSFGAAGLSSIVDKSNNGRIGGWNFYIEDLFVFGFESNYGQFAAGGSIALGSWYQVCATWDGSSGLAGIALFLNAASVPVADSGMEHRGYHSDAARSLSVGLANSGAANFDGIIDDVFLYNRVLSPSEIRAVYDCGR